MGFQGPKKDISISMLQGCPYLIGFHPKGGYTADPYPNFAYVLLWGPKECSASVCRGLYS